MAIVRDNNKWNADLLADLTSSGSDDGVTSDVVAWAVDQNNWYYPNVINAGTSTWTALATGGASTLQESYEGGNTIVTDSTNGNLDVSGTEAVSLDATMASNFTVSSADLTLSTTTSGTVLLSAAGLLDLDAGANLDVDVTGTLDFLSTGAFSIDGTGASNLSATSGTLTLSTIVSGELNVLGADATVAATAGANVNVFAGDGNTTGNGGILALSSGSSGAGATGTGGNLTVTGGSALSTNGDGGDLLLIPGAATGSGTEGFVSVDAAVAVGDIMLRLDRADGTAGSVSDMFVGQGTPSFTAKAGSIYLQNDGATATGGAIWVQEDASGASDDGSTWTELGSGGGGGGSAWSEETTQTTDATAGVTIATPISPVTDATQHSVEVLITAESGGANTFFRRQVFTFYRDGGGAVQWTTEVNGTIALRGFTTATASLSVSGNDVLVTATGEAATTINWTVQYRTTNTITNGGTVSTTGIVRETFDNRGSATTTGSATASGGTVDFTLAVGSAYGTLQFLRIVTATGTCADATVQFFRDAGRTDEIYDAQNKDPSTQYTDRVPATMMGDDGTGLASNTMYGRITNNDAGSATFDVEAVFWGVV